MLMSNKKSNEQICVIIELSVVQIKLNYNKH